MSAPKPSSTTEKKEKNYIIELDSKSYNLSFILSDSLIIISFIDNISIPQKIYEEKFSYDSISKKSKIFKIYDSIEEIYHNLINFMNIKKYSIEMNNNSIIINFNLDVGKFDLELSLKKTNMNDSINFLIEKVKFLIEENKNSKEKINLLLEENKEIKNKINLLINENELLKQNNKKEENNLFKGSTIIQSDEEKKIIDNWILKNTKKNTTLIYKAKKDGDDSSIFHSKCDNMGPLLIIIQTTSGYRFGGYTSKSWTKPNSSIWIKDELAFVFSLNLLRKFEIKIPEQAIGHYGSDGPVFGYGHCIHIVSECLHNNKSYHDSSSSYEGMNQLIFVKEKYFTVADYEVFQIKFQ